MRQTSLPELGPDGRGDSESVWTQEFTPTKSEALHNNWTKPRGPLIEDLGYSGNYNHKDRNIMEWNSCDNQGDEQCYADLWLESKTGRLISPRIDQPVGAGDIVTQDYNRVPGRTYCQGYNTEYQDTDIDEEGTQERVAHQDVDGYGTCKYVYG